MLDTSNDRSALDYMAPSLRRSIAPLFIVASAVIAAFSVMNSFGVIQQSAKDEMGLSDTVLGLVQGVSVAVQVTLFTIPIGRMADRFNRVRLLFLLGVVWTAGTVLTALAFNPWVLFAGRMLASVGGTGGWTTALSLAADFGRPAERGRTLLIVALGKILGQAVAFGLTGWLLGLFLHGAAPGWFAGIAPWRSTHYALAMFSLALILPLLFMREPERRGVETSTQAPLQVIAHELWSRRRFLIPLYIGTACVVMADASAAIWVSPVLSRNYGLSPEQFAGWMSALVIAVGAGGAIIGGFVADWGRKSGFRGGILIGSVIASAVSIPCALFPIAPSAPLYGLGFGMLLLCGMVANLVAQTAKTVLIPNEARGLCIGISITIGSLMGFGVAPTLIARVSILLGGERHLGQALAMVGAANSVVSFVGFMLAKRHAGVVCANSRNTAEETVRHFDRRP
jgi:MFS family permease